MQFLSWLLNLLTYSNVWGDWCVQVIMYLWATMSDGDYLNDWRTHILDPHVRQAAEYVGKFLVDALGL